MAKAQSKKAPPKSKAQTRTVGRPRKYTREQVVEVAIQLIDEKGYEALSVRALARKLNVIPATIYSYFENVDDLAGEVMKEVQNSVDLPDPTNSTSMRQQLISFLVSYRDNLSRFPNLLSPTIGSPAWQQFMIGIDYLIGCVKTAKGTPEQHAMALYTLLAVVSLSAAREHNGFEGPDSAGQQAALEMLPKGFSDHIGVAPFVVDSTHSESGWLEAWLGELIDMMLPGLK